MSTNTTDEPVLLTPEQAEALLPDGGDIHTFLNPGGMLLGADWRREQVLELLRTSDRREVTGPAAQSMGHGLCAFRDDGVPVFIETRRETTESEASS
jgi:hypothetical protein